MTIHRRIDALEHLLDRLNDSEWCPDCRGPHRSSRSVCIDADTAGGVCHRCRRVLDRDGLPITGRHFVLALVNYPPDAPVLTSNDRADSPICWAGDGLPVFIDAAKITIIDCPI